MPTQKLEQILEILRVVYPYHPMGDVTGRDPFKVLICCLLSLRSRDVVTMPVCTQLFQMADTPEKLLALPRERLLALIKPVQFYERKAETLRQVCQELLERFGGQVPADLDALDSLRGVGRKTANLVLQLGFNLPAVCVDTHVHRICNRLGVLATRSPEQTEAVLREILDVRYWNVINRVMVRHGQEICTAHHPACDICPVFAQCDRVDVTPRKSRAPKKEIHAVFRPRQTIPAND